MSYPSISNYKEPKIYINLKLFWLSSILYSWLATSTSLQMFRLLPASGVAMSVCTVLLPFLGLAMVLDFALGMPDEMSEEEADSPRDPVFLTRRATSRNKTICRIIIRIIVMAATLPILLWTVYMGYSLVNGPTNKKDANVALVAGVITMTFGISLLLNGIAIAKELSQELSNLMQLADFGADTQTRQQLACLKA